MTLPQLANIARGGKAPRGPELGAAGGAEFRRRLMARAGLDPDAPPVPLAE